MSEDIKRKKLSAIYDAIDGRDYVGAIKLCQKKEIYNLDIAKVIYTSTLLSF